MPPKNGHQIASTLPTCTPEVCTSPLCEEDSQVLRCPDPKVQIYQSHSMMCFFHMKDLQILFKYFYHYIYQNLQRGAKWFLNGVSSPSLIGFLLAPLSRFWYVVYIYTYFNLTSLQRFEKRVTQGAKCWHMECYYSWTSCLAKSSSFSIASPFFVKKQALASSKWPFDTWNGGYDSPLIKFDQGHFENHLA